MVGRRSYVICRGIIALLLLVLGIGLLVNMTNANSYVPEIEQKARASQSVPDSWSTVSETTDDVAAVLMYDGDSKEHIFAVYLKETGISAEDTFSMIAGGAIPVNQSDIAELYSNDFEEYIYVSMNRQKACLLQITAESKFSTIQIDPDKPFVIILSTKDGDVTFYDANNQVISFDALEL